MTEKWLQVSEAARVLGITERTLRKHISEDKIKSKLEDSRRLVLVNTDDIVPETPPHEEIMIDQLRSESEHLRSELLIRDKEVAELRQEIKQKDEYIREKDTHLRQKDEQWEQASQRHDTIVLQLTRQLDNQQRLLEYHESPWYQRWFHRSKKVRGAEEANQIFDADKV